MKNLFLLLIITTFFSSCERDYIKNNTLPPLTHTGANTAGCLVNGEVFVPKGKWFENVLDSSYSGSHFVLHIYQKKINEIKTLSIHCLHPLHENLEMVYILDEKNLSLNSGGFAHLSLYYFNSLSDNTTYVTNDVFKGELVLTYFDFEKRIVSGTFWFDAVNDKGEVVEIRDGRFDVKFN